MNPSEIALHLSANEIPFDPALPSLLARYLSLLEIWNQRMDLTAVLEPTEMLDRHFVDSLTVLRTSLLGSAASLVDVGTGAGFPGLVLALACPSLQVTLLDAQRKRLDFLRVVAEETGANNVSFVHARAEEGGRLPNLRQSFDLAIARAVAPLPVLCELLLPFVRLGGSALCWKGPALADELKQGRRAAHLLGGAIGEPVSCPVRGRDWDHCILPVAKVSATPAKYPRRPGTPSASPLG